MKNEQELADSHQIINRTILLDKADELIDSEKTLSNYQAIADFHILRPMRDQAPSSQRKAPFFAFAPNKENVLRRRYVIARAQLWRRIGLETPSQVKPIL